MDVAHFIRELISSNECVILRGIGGFETKYKHASVDKRNKRISPPGKTIRFRPDMVRDNGILENHLSKSLGIDKKEASELIDEFVQNFHHTIADQGRVFIEGIGGFKRGKDNAIIFQEIRDESYLVDSFGLDILNIESEISGNPQMKKTETHRPRAERNRVSGWYIAIGILVVLIAITSLLMITSSSEDSLFDKLTGKTGGERLDVIVFTPQTDVKQDSVKQALGKSIDDNTTPKKALAIEPATQIHKPEPVFKYHLIAGSFKSQQNAEKLISQLHTEGFDPTIMSRGSYTRVVIGSFNDKNLAINELRRIRNQLDQSVWLLTESN